MNLVARKTLWGCAGLLILAIGVPSTQGQITNLPRGSNRSFESPPVPQPAKPPVEFFRELLAMTLVERNQALADRPPEIRKVREYEAMKPDERKLRLQATELRWYMLPLMRAPPANRELQLSNVPTNLLPLVTARLVDWDKLSSDGQKEFLARESAIQYFIQPKGGTNATLWNVNTSTNKQRLLEAGVTELQKLPPEKREALLTRWQRIFELSDAEKDKALKTLTVAERAQIEKTLRKFENLTAAQRATCVRSFEFFARMNAFERQEFLKNAAKWTRMTDQQRRQWQDLVDLAPLLPTPVGAIAPPPPRPPMAPKKTGLATNGG
jgi:hypothetical protein